MKAALRKTLDGTSYRAAGSECGADYRDLHKNAKRLRPGPCAPRSVGGITGVQRSLRPGSTLSGGSTTA